MIGNHGRFRFKSPNRAIVQHSSSNGTILKGHRKEARTLWTFPVPPISLDVVLFWIAASE